MRAVGIRAFGGPEKLSVLDLPVPEPGPGQVRVRVAAAAVHNFDTVARTGRLGPLLPERDHYVFGWDMSGVVDAVGRSVDGFAVGDAVVGISDWLETFTGTQAEYVVLDARALAPAPRSCGLIDAAALPVNALTALQALDRLDLKEGRTLAVTGAGGAVGGYAIELARERGLHTVGLCSERDKEFVTERGAVYVPRSDDPVEALRSAAPEGIDGLLDAAAIGPDMLAAVRDGGAFAGLTPPKTPRPERGIDVHQIHMHSDGPQLRELVSLVDRGRMTLRPPQVFGFDQAAQAHELLSGGGVRGRLLLVP
ncbi:NADP-dependent oxidoreductase [Streptomyces sp. NPDC001668]|uniref:NADP-dependent oxidoreductase n=1 Tax=unclassified Streptomyces TaxID=2593676 RepID=UPI0033F6E22C